MPAATLPAAYVRARWAYSELLSCRPYRGIGVQELKRRAKGHVPFDDLRGEERDQLEQAWYRVRGVPTFINAFAGIATFELVQWSKEQLGAVYVIKFFAQEVGNHSVPMSFKQWIETEPSDSIELGHARHAASGAVPSTGVEQLLLANYHVVATTSEQSSSKINLHRGNGIPRPRDKRPKIAFRPETVFAETKAQTQKPANCGLLGRLREICRFERLRGGPCRTRNPRPERYGRTFRRVMPAGAAGLSLLMQRRENAGRGGMLRNSVAWHG